MSAYEAARATSYIIDLDANNFSWWAISQAMPIDALKWMIPNEARGIGWLAHTDDQPVGYIIEASLH